MRQNNTCPICNAKEVEYRTLVSQGRVPQISKPGQLLNVMICSACGHGQRSETRDFNTNLQMQQETFERNVPEPDIRETRWPRRTAMIASEIRRLARPGKALDIGCHTGIWLATLGEGWEKYGVEINRVAAPVARRFSQAEVFCGPFESYDCGSASFDLITAFALIEHLSNPQVLVELAYEHLAPGGLLVLMTGDRESRVAQAMGSDWPLYWSPNHISFFSARSLCRLVQNYGFDVVRQEWRFMYTSRGLASPILKSMLKLKEILRINTSPIYDHYYCYARKPV